MKEHAYTRLVQLHRDGEGSTHLYHNKVAFNTSCCKNLSGSDVRAKRSWDTYYISTLAELKALVEEFVLGEGRVERWTRVVKTSERY